LRGGPAAALASPTSLISEAAHPPGGGDPGSLPLALAIAGRSRAALEMVSGRESTSTSAGLAAVLAACDDGWLDRAASLADEAVTDTAWVGTTEPRMWFALVAGRVALRRGWASAASRWYAEAAALAEECGVPGGGRLAASGLSVAGAWHPAARRSTGRVVTGGLPPRPREPADAPAVTGPDLRGGLLLLAEPVLAAAWSQARRGDLDTAHRWLAAGHRRAVERGALSDAAWIGYGYVRLARPDLAVAALHPLREQVDGTLLHAWADHATAAAAGDPGALATVGDRLAVCGAWLDAATALAQAAAAADDPASGLVWRSQARDYLARCGSWQVSAAPVDGPLESRPVPA
jgi:hypothetical protein